MLLTEDEARKKMCPVADNTKLRGDCCIASSCMAWRWGSGREVGTDRRCERCNGSGVVGGEECEGCVVGYQTEIMPDGFCGYAGGAE